MPEHRRTLPFVLAALLSAALSVEGAAQTCLGLPTEAGDRLLGLSFRPGQVALEGAVNPLGPAGFATGVARREVPLAGESETRSVRLSLEKIEWGRFSLCPMAAIEYRRSPTGAEALRMPLGIGVGATFDLLEDAGWGPYAMLGFLPNAPTPRRPGDLFLERPLYQASLVDRLGLMTWKGPLFATASLRALAAARPDLRLGIRF